MAGKWEVVDKLCSEGSWEHPQRCTGLTQELQPLPCKEGISAICLKLAVFNLQNEGELEVSFIFLQYIPLGKLQITPNYHLQMYLVLLKPRKFAIKHIRANWVPDACEFWLQIPKATRIITWQNILKYFCHVGHFPGTRNDHSNLQKSQNHMELNAKGSRGKWGLSWIPPDLFDDLVKSWKNWDFKIRFQVVWGFFFLPAYLYLIHLRCSMRMWAWNQQQARNSLLEGEKRKTTRCR